MAVPYKQDTTKETLYFSQGQEALIKINQASEGPHAND